MYTVLERKLNQWRTAIANGRISLREGQQIETEGYLFRAPELDGAYSHLLAYTRMHFNCQSSMYGFAVVPGSGLRFSQDRRLATRTPVLVAECKFKKRIPSTPVRISGVLANAYDFEGRREYFIILDDFSPLRVEDYYNVGKPMLDNGALRNLIDGLFGEDLRAVMKYSLSSSASIMRVFPGTSAGFGVPDVEGYGIRKEEWKLLKNSLPPLLTHGDILEAELDWGIARSKRKILFPNSYDFERDKGFAHYTANRQNEGWQQRRRKYGNYMLSSNAKAKVRSAVVNLLNSADAPYIPTEQEAIVVDAYSLKEYATDIAYHGFWHYLATPEVDVRDYTKDVDYIIHKITREFPHIHAYMTLSDDILQRYGVPLPSFNLYDSTDGFGFHLRKLLNSSEWLGEDKRSVWGSYIEPFFTRLDELYGPYLTRCVAIADTESTRQKQIDRLLSDMNIVAKLRTPQGKRGWTEAEFIERGIARGVFQGPEEGVRILNQRVNNGDVLKLGVSMLTNEELYWFIGEGRNPTT